MSKPLNLTHKPQSLDICVEYLYQDELVELFNRIWKRKQDAVFTDDLLRLVHTHHRMELRAVSLATRGDLEPYTESEILEVFNPKVLLSPTMPYGYFYHKALTEAGYTVEYIHGSSK